jgi:hypothetical protein
MILRSNAFWLTKENEIISEEIQQGVSQFYSPSIKNSDGNTTIVK